MGSNWRLSQGDVWAESEIKEGKAMVEGNEFQAEGTAWAKAQSSGTALYLWWGRGGETEASRDQWRTNGGGQWWEKSSGGW